jgi:oligopeptide transport system substrate-binding protein
MRRNLISAFLVLVAALLVVGLTLSRSTRGRADFAFVNGTEPKTLDPNVITGEPEGRIAQEVFEGLTRLEARSLEPVPGAAESWEITPDGKTYTFHIRPTARWSDGHPVTAHDFAYSWKRMQEPALGTEYAYIMHMMRFAEAYNTHAAQADALQGPILKALDELTAKYPGLVPKEAVRAFDATQGLHGVLKGTPNPKLSAFLSRPSSDSSHAELVDLRRELQTEGARRRALHDEAVRHFGVDGGVYAKDDRTLVVELVAPTPYFLELTAFHSFYPVPRWVVERSPHAWFLPGSIVGNGPFLLADWRVGDRIRLERSPTYWGRDAVKLKSAEALAIENVTTALNLYLTGEVDWLPHNTYPLDLSLDLKKRPDFYVGPALIAYFYRINSTKKPFNDVRVRRAINLAIDREQITRDVLLLGQLPATHFVPPGIRGYVPPVTGISYDVAQARKLLTEAGFPDGKGFPKFGILYNTLEAHKKLAEVVADQLHRNLNIDVAAYNQEWQSYLESERSLNYDVSRGGWVGDYEDPNTFLDIWVTNGGNNKTGWGNLVYDRLIEAAANVEKFLADPAFLLARAHDPVALKQLAEQVQTSKDAATRLDAIAKLRMALLAEAEGILINDEYPVIPLYFYVISGLVKPNVGGFYAQLVGADGQSRSNLRDLHPLRGIEMKGVGSVPVGSTP